MYTGHGTEFRLLGFGLSPVSWCNYISTNEINLLGLTRVENHCKTQKKKIYRVHDNSIRTLDEDQDIFLVTSVTYSCRLKQIFSKTYYDINTLFVQRCMWSWVHFRFFVTIDKPLLVLCCFDHCIPSVKKYTGSFGTLKCHDHDMFTLHKPVRLQHLQQGNKKWQLATKFDPLRWHFVMLSININK